jgi:hypothetical protein
MRKLFLSAVLYTSASKLLEDKRFSLIFRSTPRSVEQTTLYSKSVK